MRHACVCTSHVEALSTPLGASASLYLAMAHVWATTAGAVAALPEHTGLEQTIEQVFDQLAATSMGTQLVLEIETPYAATPPIGATNLKVLHQALHARGERLAHGLLSTPEDFANFPHDVEQ